MDAFVEQSFVEGETEAAVEESLVVHSYCDNPANEAVVEEVVVFVADADC